jgi:hypothetical protein
VVNDKMKDYFTVGLALMMISVGNFGYVVLRIWSYSAQTYWPRDTILLWLLQCSASLLCGAVGGYLLAIGAEDQKVSGQSPVPQDSSVQE